MTDVTEAGAGASGLAAGPAPARNYPLDPSRIIETAENLSRRIGEKFPGTNLAGIAAKLAAIAHVTDERAQRSRMPIYTIRVACFAVVGIAVAGLLFLAFHIRARWVFGTIGEVFETADAGVNVLIVVTGALYSLVTFEARVKRKRALTCIGELLEYVRLVDITQLYYTPELYRADQSSAESPARLDYTYLLLCTEMLALISNLTSLYTRSSLDDAVWRAAFDVVMLANGVEGRLFAKAEAIRIETA